MRAPMILASLCLLTAACADDPIDGRLGGRSVAKELCPTGCDPEVATALEAPTQWERLTDLVYVTADEPVAYDDPCALLPSDGLCAYACDPAELALHIPAGSCLEIRCELRDGREIVAGGCATQEP